MVKDTAWGQLSIFPCMVYMYDAHTDGGRGGSSREQHMYIAT